MLKLIMTSDNCFRKALAQDLFIQGSTSSLHFSYLLSDTVLQFPALALTFSAHIIRHTTMVSAISNRARGQFAADSSANRDKSAQVTERAIHIEPCYTRMTSDYFPLRDRFSRNNRPDGRNNTSPMDARHLKWFSGSILRRNTDPQVGVKR